MQQFLFETDGKFSPLLCLDPDPVCKKIMDLVCLRGWIRIQSCQTGSETLDKYYKEPEINSI